MKWLLDAVDEKIAKMAPGLFAELEVARAPFHIIGWIHQLPHMSRGFIQALCARVALCGREDEVDLRFYRAFTRHAGSEIMHPLELEDWMLGEGLSGRDGLPAFCGVPPTQATQAMVLYCWEVAEESPPDEQVVVMNVVAEGVAYRFFLSAMHALGRIGMKTGRFWRSHGDDLEHARIGVPEIGDVAQDSERGIRLWGAASVALAKIEAMLESWSAESALDARFEHAQVHDRAVDSVTAQGWRCPVQSNECAIRRQCTNKCGRIACEESSQRDASDAPLLA